MLFYHRFTGAFTRKTLMLMKLTALLMLSTCMHLYAGVNGQLVSLNAKNASLKDVFRQIGKQTNYLFVYDLDAVKKAPRISVSINKMPVEQAMDSCLKNQPFSYTIVDRTIVLKPRKEEEPHFYLPPPISVSGLLLNESGQPLQGISVMVKGTAKGTVTDDRGQFTLTDVEDNAVLVISGVNIERTEVQVAGRTSFVLNLKTAVAPLEETVVKGYYSTTRRSNTGSVGTVSAQTISNQPVTDPAAALQGRVSGLMITSSNGMPGSNFQVRIRGENSMTQGNNPLYVVDGMPYMFPGVSSLVSATLNQFSGANGDQSPLASINSADIERIDVLKDADATAIYGSRGANGVVLITTKRGKTGTSKLDINIYTGASRVANKLDMLNTQQYFELREEGFANDTAEKTMANAYDFLVWDRNHYTDWQDLLIGNTANVTEARVAFSGGNDQTSFLLSATGRKEGTVLLGDFGYKRGSTLFNINHNSKNKKFGMDASVKFVTDNNEIVPTDVSQYFGLAPNYNPYNEDGSLYWYATVQNPVAYLNRTYETRTNNLIYNTNLKYTLLPGLDIKTNFGFSITNMRQLQTLPASGFSTINPVASQAQYAFTENKSYIVEPQVDYNRMLGVGKLSLMAGASWQHSNQEGNYFFGTGYPSDALLKDMSYATPLTLRNYVFSDYNYQAVFGRIGYDIHSKYILNLTFRRDGSSRFGDGNRFGNFGAAAAAWVFSEENFVKNALPFLSFGKLRGSYGTTGNDQIGDYIYIDRWGSSSFPYAGVTGIYPESAYNPEFSWETNQKLDIALELGFLKDRIFLISSYYRNRSGNQLINRTLSPQSGFSGYFSNSPATVQNAGLEFDLNTININNRDFTWKTSFNISLPSNKLLEYPNLETSSDAVAYEIGKSTRIIKGYQFTGVDPNTGIAQFLDVNKDGVLDQAGDWVILGETLPEFFGGFLNQFTYKKLSLDIFFQFVKQEAPTVDWGPLAGAYGGLANKTTRVLDRWRKPGDITDVPRATVISSNPANVAFRNYYRTSSAVWGDASYIRLKNVSLKYDLSAITKKWKISGCSIFLQGQNLITITKYNGLDPEINGFDRRFVYPINPFGSVKTPAMPVLRTYTIGLNLSI